MRNLLLACALVCVSAPVFAQAVPAPIQDDQVDPFKTARFRSGPLALNPTIGITDVGVDTNVFNEWEDPKQDFSATLKPGTDLWFRAGRTRLTGKATLGYTYFQEYADQRYVTTDLSARYDVDLLHMRPYGIVSYLTTRERPGFEIDVRARRFERTYGVGADVPLTKRTTFGILARRYRTSYAADEVFLGTYLRDVFDRREDTIQAALRYRWTPLTTFVVAAEAGRSRFTYSPIRDSDSVRVMPGIEFNALALIQGSAYIGLRKLDMLGPSVPSYKGAVASVDLGYTLLGMTRIAVQAGRDVYYSFEIERPYYLQTGATVTVTQQIAGPFDAQARWGLQHLDYRAIAAVAQPPEPDTVRLYGGGIGYRFGHSARIGLNVESYRRHSWTYSRDYSGLRAGMSVTYGF